MRIIQKLATYVNGLEGVGMVAARIIGSGSIVAVVDLLCIPPLS